MDKLLPRGEFDGPNHDILVLDRAAIFENINELVPQYAQLNTLAFALEEPTEADEARARLESSDLLLLACDEVGELMGFATYQFIPSDMGKVIYQARGLIAGSRGRGVGRRFPQIAARTLRADFLIAKAQNPISIWSTIESGLFETVYPLHGDFSDSPEMQHVLIDTVAARGKVGEVDLNTGIHPGSYPMGKLGDYNPNASHAGVMQVLTRLQELGVDASHGDAVYYGGKII